MNGGGGGGLHPGPFTNSNYDPLVSQVDLGFFSQSQCGALLRPSSYWLPLKGLLRWLIRVWKRGEGLPLVLQCLSSRVISTLPSQPCLAQRASLHPACDAGSLFCPPTLPRCTAVSPPTPWVYTHTHTHPSLQWVFTRRPQRQFLCCSERTLEPSGCFLSWFILLDPGGSVVVFALLSSCTLMLTFLSFSCLVGTRCTCGGCYWAGLSLVTRLQSP